MSNGELKEVSETETQESLKVSQMEQMHSMAEQYFSIIEGMSDAEKEKFHDKMSQDNYNEWRKSHKGTLDDFRKEVMDSYVKDMTATEAENTNDYKSGEIISMCTPTIHDSKGISIEYETAEPPEDMKFDLPQYSIVYVKEFKDNRQIKITPEGFQNDDAYKAVTTQELTLYRTYGGKAREDGCYVSTSRDIDRMDAKEHNALMNEWKNTRTYTEKVTIPPGTEIYIGKVGEQPTYSGSSEMLGGGMDQIVLPKNYTKFVNPSGTEILSEKEELKFKKGNINE